MGYKSYSSPWCGEAMFFRNRVTGAVRAAWTECDSDIKTNGSRTGKYAVVWWPTVEYVDPENPDKCGDWVMLTSDDLKEYLKS